MRESSCSRRQQKSHLLFVEKRHVEDGADTLEAVSTMNGIRSGGNPFQALDALVVGGCFVYFANQRDVALRNGWVRKAWNNGRRNADHAQHQEEPNLDRLRQRRFEYSACAGHKFSNVFRTERILAEKNDGS